jgi:cobalamin-dependent methionine synthase I
MDTVYVKSYKAPEYNYNEILRYAQISEDSDDIRTLINSCISELNDKLQYYICYREYPISFLSNKSQKDNDYNAINLGFMTTTSSNLSKNLEECTHIIVFAATIGIHIDRLISKYSASSPSKGIIMHAIGNERIESLCNMFNNDIILEKHELGHTTKPRFSPGYGDFDILAQKDIFEALNCPKNIGLTLNDNMLMSPSKSVTAIIGIR